MINQQFFGVKHTDSACDPERLHSGYGSIQTGMPRLMQFSFSVRRFSLRNLMQPSVALEPMEAPMEAGSCVPWIPMPLHWVFSLMDHRAQAFFITPLPSLKSWVQLPASCTCCTENLLRRTAVSRLQLLPLIFADCRRISGNSGRVLHHI